MIMDGNDGVVAYYLYSFADCVKQVFKHLPVYLLVSSPSMSLRAHCHLPFWESRRREHCCLQVGLWGQSVMAEVKVHITSVIMDGSGGGDVAHFVCDC